MDPKAFLDFAHRLTNNNNEAALRTCVSRSYYALFNLMAKFVNENVERLSQSAEDHKKVYHYFNNCNITGIPSIASALNDLRNDRNCSDYNLGDTRFCCQSTVVLLYKKAEIAYNKFVEMVNSSGQSKQIVRQIQEYKRKTNS